MNISEKIFIIKSYSIFATHQTVRKKSYNVAQIWTGNISVNAIKLPREANAKIFIYYALPIKKMKG